MNIIETRTLTRLRTWTLVAGLTALVIALGAMIGGVFAWLFAALAVGANNWLLLLRPDAAVGKLVHLCPGDLAGRHLIVIAHVGRGIPSAVLELDVRTHPDLLDVEMGRVPVDAGSAGR